jgi:hypothetical protein
VGLIRGLLYVVWLLQVVLIGDGMAAGYGSFVRMGFECGVVQRLNIMYWRKETIKSKWFFFDR